MSWPPIVWASELPPVTITCCLLTTKRAPGSTTGLRGMNTQDRKLRPSIRIITRGTHRVASLLMTSVQHAVGNKDFGAWWGDGQFIGGRQRAIKARPGCLESAHCSATPISSHKIFEWKHVKRTKVHPTF
ncbi:hypothetical protein BOTBODRAFT_249911 [Botryobasidium botryosum FD-172 SS1]|uniref:Uncharacterized protein n=1 Tax=Botryobasidium botryosum (strain FD-172 SS1) TaxID=930990 RepID=A0A067MLQ6_BOTB1|nr:hypothetical protein BOTBODRAFT_249911 [Botryobasidium botryosum FD-172 SS1]